MFIQTEDTPNPATMKFLPGRAVMGAGTADFPTPDSAERSPLATSLFNVAHVSAVFLGSDFVSGQTYTINVNDYTTSFVME